jgi:quercetin dioxygenase-like cupin family protein
MSDNGNSSVAPITLTGNAGEALWFLGTLATIKASGESTAGRLALIDNLAAKGAGSPVHVHRREDEWFYVSEGELAFWLQGKVIEAPAGSFVYLPRDVPHLYEVASEQARYLFALQPAGFEEFMRAAGEPAPSLEIPPPPSEPPDPERLTAIAAEYGIEITGPPGIPS